MTTASDPEGRPTLGHLSRRQVLKLLGLGVGGVAAVGTVVLELERVRDGAATLPWDESVWRNPAFRATQGEAPGHQVLHCRLRTGDYLAYDLNASGYRVWEACASHAEAMEGASKTVATVASSLADDLGEEAVRRFLGALATNGLVCVGASVLAFVREGDS